MLYQKLGTLLLAFVFTMGLRAQRVELSGKVQDSLENPIAFASIIADPLGDRATLTYTLSEEDGHYALLLKQGSAYRITVSYMGFQPETFKFRAETDTIEHIQLKIKNNQLGAVEITYTPPIRVREDTITFRADSFTTGTERKLRDIIGKLPAFDIDRSGNVRFKGKKVDELLVEDKQFFTGDTKLGVNNIPADAVDKIQILENYNEVEFLKNLEDDDKLAMNVKLKKEKKRFVFGDVEAGGGVEKRYLLHPSLYYYSPKRQVNFIGDLNNTGKRSFTFEDYLNFEDGGRSLIRDPQSYFSIRNSSFAQFLRNQDFIKSKIQFGALSLSQSLSDKTDFSAYGIITKTDDENRQSQRNRYTENNIIENRLTTGQQKSFFGLGKLSLTSKPDQNTDIKWDSFFRFSNNRNRDLMSTSTPSNENEILTRNKLKNALVKENFEWHKQHNLNHTTSVVFNYKYQQYRPDINWLTDRSILQGLIPVVPQDEFDLFSTKSLRTNDFDLVAKHYWILNNTNHIYFTAGAQMVFDRFVSNGFQILDDNTVNSFSDSGFSNDLKSRFNDSFLGVQYKILLGKFTLKPGLMFHHYDRKVKQVEKYGLHKNLLLPEFETEIRFNESEKLTFDYNLKARFPSATQLSNGAMLLSFNAIYRGNPQLENTLYHNARVYFHHFTLHNNLFYHLDFDFNSQIKSLKSETELQDIDRITTPILAHFKDNSWNLGGGLKKGVGKFKISGEASISFATYDLPVNEALIRNKSKSYRVGIGGETKFSTGPNLSLKYTKIWSDYKTTQQSKFNIDRIATNVDYNFFNDFIFEAHYSFEKYNAKSFGNTNTFHTARASLFYQKEDSPWGFEVSIRNIFNNKYRKRNTLSTILTTDQRTFVLPRMAMLTLSYKL